MHNPAAAPKIGSASHGKDPPPARGLVPVRSVAPQPSQVSVLGVPPGGSAPTRPHAPHTYVGAVASGITSVRAPAPALSRLRKPSWLHGTATCPQRRSTPGRAFAIL